MPNNISSRLPWENAVDVSLHSNEYIQISTLNRPLKRLLENIKWIMRCTFILTPDSVTTPASVTGSGKYVKIETSDGVDTYYIPLYKAT
jgi:hypothetical protein